MTENKNLPEANNVNPAIMQEIGMLNLRINDMMTQLNTVMKTLTDENKRLMAENLVLRGLKEENKVGVS